MSIKERILNFFRKEEVETTPYIMASNNSHHVSVDHLLLGKEAYIDAFFKILVKKLSDKQLNSLEVILKHQKDERIKIGNNNGDTKNIISPSNGEGI